MSKVTEKKTAALTANDRMAAALIGTKTLPAGLKHVIEQAGQAWAYHRLDPYPLYHFRDWMTEDRGPLPRCLPIAQSAVKRGARFLFGKPITLTCANNPAWEQFLRRAWADNRMDARLVPMAVKGALEGGVVLKFDYDESRREKPLAIQSLSVVDQVRLFMHPHESDTILMARVQYPYADPDDGKTYWYREEWTAREEVHYAPLPASGLDASHFNPDTCDQWIESGRQANPFGAIPLLYVKNLESDDAWGLPDLADLYRVLDNIHLTYHLMNKSNQFDSELNPIFQDLDVDEQDIDKPLQPGQPLDVHSQEGKQGKVYFPDGSNSLRPAMMEYAKDLRKQVLMAAGSVEVDQGEFTNKGNLTVAVLEQLFQPQIEITEEKRKSWGQGGLCAFFGLMARSLKNAGAEVDVDPDDRESWEVSLKWPAYFPLSEDEKAAKTGRLQEQEAAGYLPHDRAIEEIAEMEGRNDVDALKEELEKTPPVAYQTAQAQAQAAVQSAQQEVKGLQREGGADAQ